MSTTFRRHVGTLILLATTIAVPLLAVGGAANAAEYSARGFITSASVADTVEVGASTPISATVTATRDRRALVDVAVFDGDGRQVIERSWDRVAFSANQPQVFAIDWDVPADATTGEYTIDVEVHRTGHRRLLHRNDSAGTVEVVAGTGSSPAVLTTDAIADPAVVRPGDPVALTASVTSDADRTLLVDVEVYDASGNKVFQQWWDDETFATAESRTFTTEWTPAPNRQPGEYTVMIGLFGAGWGSFVDWNPDAATIRIDADPITTTPPTTTPPTTTPPTTTPPTTTPPTTTPPTTTPPTTTPPTTTPPTTTPPTTTPPTTTPPTTGRFETLPVGAALPSGAECASQVRSAAEIRPENAAANANRGSRANANNRTDWSGFDRVDGDFSGTTDEVIQWAACKWGIDEDIARAQVVKESFWYQSANGDGGESWGLGQVRDGYGHEPAFEYAVNARTSTAYNLDYTYASWRACYEGVYTWLNHVERGATYGPGDAWGCTGVWFSGRWYTDPAIRYIEGGPTGGYGDIGVKEHLAARTWETWEFING